MTVQTQGTINALAHMAASAGHSHSITTSMPTHSHGIVGAVGAGGSGGGYGGFNGANYGAGNYGNLIISPTSAVSGSLTGNIGGFTIYSGVPLASNMRFDSNNPLQLYVFNKAVPEGESFTKSKDLFGTDFRLDEQQHMIHHYLMWATEYGEEFTDYGTVMRSNDGCFAAFGSKETRDHFQEWFERYRTVFFKGYDVATNQYPAVEPGALNGFYVKETRRDKDAGIAYLGHNELTEKDWSWITAHCAHQVLRFQNGWFFTHESDAVLFKMKPEY